MTSGQRRIFMTQTAEEKETMFKNAKAFSSFSVSDIREAREFYGEKLGLDVSDGKEGLSITLSGGGSVFLYTKADHTAASFTVLNFHADNIDEAVDELKSRGVSFESYEGSIKTDEKCIFRGAERGHGHRLVYESFGQHSLGCRS